MNAKLNTIFFKMKCIMKNVDNGDDDEDERNSKKKQENMRIKKSLPCIPVCAHPHSQDRIVAESHGIGR